MAKKKEQDLLEHALRIADGQAVDWRRVGPCDLETAGRMNGLRHLEAIAHAFRSGPPADKVRAGKKHGAKPK